MTLTGCHCCLFPGVDGHVWPRGGYWVDVAVCRGALVVGGAHVWWPGEAWNRRGAAVPERAGPHCQSVPQTLPSLQSFHKRGEELELKEIPISVLRISKFDKKESGYDLNIMIDLITDQYFIIQSKLFSEHDQVLRLESSGGQSQLRKQLGFHQSCFSLIQLKII